MEQEPVRGQWPLNRQPELLLHGAHVVFGGFSFGSNLLALELALDVGVNGAKHVHLGQLLGLDEADLELLELFLDLGRHQHDRVCRIWSSLVIELDLLVARALDCDTYLEVASYL